MIETLTDILKEGATRYGEKLAQGNGAKDLSYQDLWERARNGALQLGPGGPVMLHGLPGPDWMVGFFSILCTGRPVVPVSAASSVEYLTTVFDHAGIDVIVGSAGLHDPEQDCERYMLGTLGEAPEHGELPRISPEDTAMIAFTSGSTQQPRAVMLTHRNLVANIHGLIAVQQVGEEDNFLSLLPPHHLFELVVGQLAPMVLGASIKYPCALLPNRILEALQTQAITYMLVVPAVLGLIASESRELLIEQGILAETSRKNPIESIPGLLLKGDPALLDDINRILGPTLKCVVVGGAGVGPQWNAVFKLLGRELFVGYGLTEASPILTCTRTTDCPAGSVGRALPNVELQINDSNEILARGPNIMQGYLAESPLHDEWLKTGDLGRLDDNGNLFITGRSKEAMVNASGETIFPDEIEPYYQHEDFHEACVAPIAGMDGNDHPTLVIYPKHDADSVQQIMKELASRAPARVRVHDYVVIDHPLPRTELGKIQRRALGEKIGRRDHG